MSAMPLALYPPSREAIPRLVQILFSAFANDSLLMKNVTLPRPQTTLDVFRQF